MTTDLPSAAAEYHAAWQAVEDAKEQVRARQQDVRDKREALTEAIVAAAKAGTRMRDLVAETNLSREWIRQLLRANGVESDR